MTGDPRPRATIGVAKGGNALLRRNQALPPDNQLANVRRAAAQLGGLASRYDLVLPHGKGPQVGLLALQPAPRYAWAGVFPGRARSADRWHDYLAVYL